MNEIATLYAKIGANIDPLKHGLSSGKRLVQDFASSFKSTMSSGLSSVKNLAAGFFYVGNSIKMVIGLAESLADALLGPAIAFERQDIALTALLGSQQEAAAWWEKLSGFAQQYALDLAELQQMAPRLAVLSQGDVKIAENYAFALAQIKTLAPQLPQQRVMGAIEAIQEQDWKRVGMLLDLPASMMEELATNLGFAVDKVTEGNDKMAKEIGRTATYIELGGAGIGEMAKRMGIEEVNKFLSALGATPDMMEAVGNSMSGQLQKLENHWLKFRQTVGGKVLEALAEPLDRLLTWLEENEDLVLKLAEAFGNFLATGIKDVVEALAGIDWENLTATIEKIIGLLGGGGEKPLALKALGAGAEAASVIAPGGKGYEAIGKAWGGVGGNLKTILGTAFTDPRLLLGAMHKAQPSKAERVLVDINLNHEMLQAEVQQTADGRVAEGLNQYGRALAGAQ